MTFLQPALLWGLAAVSVPILIHFLNRLRYRSVQWGAMMFLVRAARSSTRHARLRQYLILLFRSLLVLCFVLAIARPLVGGWLGMRIAGEPDTIILLLDRSASMEAVDPRVQASKRAHALKQLSDVAVQTAGSSRLVLIESALGTPHEIADPSVLPELTLTGPTDTAADFPAMFRAAFDYIVENHTGRTEIWVASDMRTADWRPDSPEWSRLRSQFRALPQDVQVRLLALTTPSRLNVSVALTDVFRRKGKDADALEVGMDLVRSGNADETFPITVTLDGVRSQFDAELKAQRVRISRRLKLPVDGQTGGWGMIELPADENNRDNTCYFVYGPRVRTDTAVVTASDTVGRFVRLAAAPAPDRLNQQATCEPPIDASQVELDSLSLLVWQAPAPEDELAGRIRSFVEAGGTLFCLPPGTPNVPGPMGLRWGNIEKADDAAPFRLSSWDEMDGPLARTADGANLPVARLECRRRQLYTTPEGTTNADATAAFGVPAGWYAVARFTDARPFLVRKRLGKGEVFACASLPDGDWSDLGEGMVLVPMLQRMARRGSGRLQQIETAVCGRWRPAGEGKTWVPVDSQTHRDSRWQAGVYAAGPRRLALNRPAQEHLPDTLDEEQTRELLGDMPLQVLTEAGGARAGSLQTEIWRIFVFCALVCAVVESWLALGEHVRASASNRQNMETTRSMP